MNDPAIHCYCEVDSMLQDDAGATPSDLTLLDRDEVCRLFGGPTKPINASTLYRGINAKKYPPPVKDGTRSRWLKSECEAVLRRLIAERRQHEVVAA
jgi:predicted DNA-binding transcriptional regulator AlpA